MVPNSPICPADTVTRVACVGDSLTVGDALHAYKPNSVSRCSWNDPACRGNYPMVLGALLGPRFVVRNFGATSWPACGRLPPACFERAVAAQPANSTKPLAASADGDALEACTKAFGETPLLRHALTFAPHVVVLMIGTNDAMGSYWERCGVEGFERAFALMLRLLWASGKAPFVLVLEPPPVLGELGDSGCMATRLCRFSSRGCHGAHRTAECTSCYPGDLEERGGCIWVPPLRRVRRPGRDRIRPDPIPRLCYPAAQPPASSDPSA